MYHYVGIVLVKPDGSVLAQHRDNKSNVAEPDTWGVCGGRTENGDASLAHAAVRELFEETGYLASPFDLKLLDQDEFHTDSGLVKRVIFWARYDGKQPIECFEGQEIRFLAPTEINSGLLKFCDPYHRGYLRQAAEQVFGHHVEKL